MLPGGNNFDYDLAVIGGGSAGFAAARTAAEARLNVVVIEGGDELGGLCILRGCMPTKALLYAAEVIHLARQAQVWGIQTRDVGFDFGAVMSRKEKLIADFASHRGEQLTNGRFKLIRARARFLEPHTLALSTGQVLTAKNFIISTGSVISRSPLPELETVGYIDSDDALSLDHLPQSLIVLGGGAVGVEFAQFFSRFGVRVTLIQRSEHVLREMDRDLATVLESVFRREGMVVHTHTKLLDARRAGKLKTVTFEQNGKLVQTSADEIFFALGRSANTAGLGLEHAGVVTTGGRIPTKASMQTNVPHIYAAGDCTGPYEIVHVAIQQGEIAAHNIINPRQQRQIDYRLLTFVIFTEPQIAIVGLTETEALALDIPYLAATYPFSDHGKSLIMEALDGFVKLLADPESGEILGGGCVGPMGSELIHEIVAAMHKRMTVHELRTMPHYHPTLAEIWTHPAEELSEKIHPRSTRKNLL